MEVEPSEDDVFRFAQPLAPLPFLSRPAVPPSKKAKPTDQFDLKFARVAHAKTPLHEVSRLYFVRLDLRGKAVPAAQPGEVS